MIILHFVASRAKTAVSRIQVNTLSKLKSRLDLPLKQRLKIN